MATKKKMLQAAAGNAAASGGAGGLNVEEVFSTYLYTGNGSAQTITNGIDLDGEGGMVWHKQRTSTASHNIQDTEQGTGVMLTTNGNGGQSSHTERVTSFNSNGFSVGSQSRVNAASNDYVSWTFRKAPKFFDVVTYTGNGSTQNIAHNLGAIPGCVIFKRTDSSADWLVWHRNVNGTDADGSIRLNTTAAKANGQPWDWDGVTDTYFPLISDWTEVNANGGSYVAYLFAHNDGDGDFGPDGDADIIKCGSYTTDANEDATVDLGFEPQWVLAKRTDSSTGGTWTLYDSMRGLPADFITQSALLEANDSNAENNVNRMILTPTGFKVDNYGANRDYIYIAIRRGPMAVPTDATDVFAIATRGAVSGEPGFRSDTGVVDMALVKTVNTSSDWNAKSRLTQGKYLVPNSTAAEASLGYAMFDYMNGHSAFDGTNPNTHSWMWRRAPSFCDVVAYTGNGTAGRTVSHNLGVAPELFAVKRRDTTGNWNVYFNTGNPSVNNGLGLLRFNTTDADLNGTTFWNNTHPTDSVFTVGSHSQVNASGGNYIAYLFASLDGVSKVGSYTGNGTSQTIDCGFTNGARFVLIKRTDSTGSWCVFDSERGIVAGNDPVLYLQVTNAQVTTIDWIDPNNSGFEIVTSQANINANGGSYIFYAIA